MAHQWGDFDNTPVIFSDSHWNDDFQKKSIGAK